MTNKTLGRPPVMSDRILQKLEDGFIMGYTDEEACIFVDIAPSTFYSYCKGNPDFSERKERLKKTLSLHAKRNLSTAIKDGNLRQSIWWLERKNKNEFSPDIKVSAWDMPRDTTSHQRGMEAVRKLLKLVWKDPQDKRG